MKGRERAIVNQTNIGTVSKATLGKLLRDVMECILAFLSAEIPARTKLNWTTVDLGDFPLLHSVTEDFTWVDFLSGLIRAGPQ